MKQILMYSMVLLAGCSGVNNNSRARQVPPLRNAPVAFGPISQACMASGRDARSRDLCGCIQSVADDMLSNSQQRRAVVFYNNPQLAQEVRQSDRSNDERFWEAYVAYGERAKTTCS
ncbi:hypothetical protein MNBD_ALPHA07-417 [hydrothermal vent metagenome]|uniref:Arginine transporter n=1 Tax=hydrothermal vent metagenome TaxID=652676 RepID=A0A3B0RJZ3_9ZZZZ